MINKLQSSKKYQEPEQNVVHIEEQIKVIVQERPPEHTKTFI